MKVTKNTAVWDKIKRDLGRKAPELRIGFFPESSYGSENENLPVAQVAQVAQWNEEGSSDNPPRPFMRVGFGGAMRQGTLDRNIREAVEAIALGNSPRAQLTILGPLMVNEMKQSIISWSTPPNSAATIAMKGKNDPLRDTDTMLNSVDFKVEN